ncbi:MAG: HU family DNA-binding protein [Desulfohalobiaceae bacterium]|nr:HU family DNA-binding protein [Desulfohalobiaceae bacterium]
MTKADLIAKIAEKTGLSKAESERALNSCLQSIEDILVQDGKLTLTGFGTFAVEERKARKGRNPQTGERITIPASKVVKFRPGKLLKESVK